jgi:gliding motility-associated-like protein
MTEFDKHIKDKMSNMKVTPSPEMKARIQAHAPKPGVRNFVKSNAGWFVGAVTLIAVVSVIMLNTQNQQTSSSDNIESTQNEVQTPSPETQNISPQSLPDKSSTSEHSESAVKPDTPDTKDIYISTYEPDMNITADKDGRWINLPPEIIISEHDICKITCTEHGTYHAVWQNNKGNNTTYHITYREKPVLFTNTDTSVSTRTCIVKCRISEGDWIIPNGLKLEKSGNNEISITAERYGEYTLVRNEVDANGRYSDSIHISFIAPDKAVLVLKQPLCPGDPAIVKIPENLRVKCDNMTIEKHKENIHKLYFTNNADNYICSVYNEQGDISQVLNFNKPVKTKPIYTLKDQSCYQKGEITIPDQNDVPTYTIDGIKLNPGQSKSLEPGDYTISWTDKHGCQDEEAITIQATRSLKAEFDIETSLDGMSVRTENLSTFNGSRFTEGLSYEWYVNGEFASTLAEPELQLNALNNTIELRVNKGEFCQDITIMKDIIPDEDPIRVPSFFSPNNDGYFDEFKVIVDPRLTRFEAIISNRAGQMVYKWSNPEEGWNGKIFGKENAAEGVYFYIVRAYDSTGRPIEKRGTVQLLRK